MQYQNKWLVQLLNSRLFFPVTLTIAFMIRLALIIRPIFPIGDALFYFDSAIHWLRSGSYELASSNAPWLPIGHTVFLSLIFSVFGVHVIVVQLIQIALSLSSAFLFGLIARELKFSKEVSRLAYLLILFYPEQIVYSVLFGTETIYFFLMSIGVWTLLKAKVSSRLKWDIAAGLLLGFAVNYKPQGILIPAILLFGSLALVFRAQCLEILKRGMVIYGILILTLIPWTIRNWNLFHEIIPISQNGGIMFYLGNNPLATGAYSEAGLALLPRPHMTSTELSEESWKWVRSNPVKFIQLIPRRIFYLFKPFDHGWGCYHSSFPVQVLNDVQYTAIVNGIKDPKTMDWIKSTYDRATDAGYALREGLSDFELAHSANAILSSGTSRTPPTFFFRFVKWTHLFYCLGFWIGIGLWVLSLFKRAGRLKHFCSPQVLVPLGMSFSVVGIHALTIGDFRFSFSIIPWLMLFSAEGLLAFGGFMRPNQRRSLK